MGEVTPISAVVPDWREVMRQAEENPVEFREQFGRVEADEEPPAERIAGLKRYWIPERFQSASFATYQPRTPSQKSALRAVQAWTGYAQKGQPAMLAIIGKQGTGKSHLLYSAVSFLLNVGITGADLYARPWYRLADELRYGDVSGATRDEQMAAAVAVRQRLWDHRIVCLDEVRPTASTAFDDTELAKFACHAYDKNLAVLITTNVSPLADVMGPPAASRFTQVVVDGPDHRQEKPSGRDRAAGKESE